MSKKSAEEAPTIFHSLPNGERFNAADVDKLIKAVGHPLLNGRKAVYHWPDWPEGKPRKRFVSTRDALTGRLNSLTSGYFFDKAHYAKGSLRDARFALEKIDTASRRLLLALFDGPAPMACVQLPGFRIPSRHAYPADIVRALPADAEPYLSACASTDPQLALGADSLGESIKGIYALKEWAAKAASLVEEEAAAGHGPGAPHAGDVALNRLIEGLMYDAYEVSFGRPPGYSQNYRTGQPDGPCVRFIKGVLDHLGVSPVSNAAIAGRIKATRTRRVGKSAGKIS